MEIDEFFKLPKERARVDWKLFIKRVEGHPMTFAQMYVEFIKCGGKHESNLRRVIKKLREENRCEIRYVNNFGKVNAIYLVRLQTLRKENIRKSND